MAYWYDVEKKEVVESDRGMFHGKLMGPYDTPEQARNALETAAQRTAQWDKDNEKWDNG
ncbi:methionine aminopeptidase [Leekyejoonella antrihumi]|uniref:Methionine aminopeptidase n=1 Tax=Leekyejoonella antrihumi TaxID=1660198 RepID=A0A563DYM6_9MICO|nr:methionine aminopeptidase [Leekyejoonella antrihumi]TWP35295.1 methionine aminopeptidase [Leekyejoonella antrihumi]